MLHIRPVSDLRPTYCQKRSTGYRRLYRIRKKENQEIVSLHYESCYNQ